MSTRTAIFKEEQDGTYTGVYVHREGFIEGVGYTLHTYYRNLEKTAKLINQHKHLSSLEEDAELMDGSALTEYYKADTLADIRDFKYLVYGENGEKREFVNDDGERIQYQGSLNDGYLYVQKQDGEWLVSQAIEYSDSDMEYIMSDFEKLARYVECWR